MYELLLTLLLLALLGGLALPSFARTLAAARLRAEVNALFDAVHLARKESITRRGVVSICPSQDSESCTTGTDWSQGWIMFSNTDNDEPPVRDPGEPLLQVHRSVAEVRISANRRGFTLRRTVRRATNGTIVFCDSRDRVTPRALIVSYTGRPRVALEDNRGKPYACAH